MTEETRELQFYKGFIMKFVLIVLVGLMVSNCGKDGSNGNNGQDGVDGKDGKDGTDNRFVSSIRCSGTVPSGFWIGADVEYVAHVTAVGDTFSTAQLLFGQFTQSAARFYSVNQVGALTAAAFVPIDGFDLMKVSVDRVTLITTVEFIGDNPWFGTFTAPACTVQSYSL